MSKKALVVLVFLLFAANGLSQFYILENHAIEINVDTQGNAQVSEKFFLQFQNQQQIVDFREKAGEIGVSVSGWKSYDTRLHPYLGDEEDIVVSKIAFVEEGAPHLEIAYGLKDSFMQKTNETSRVIDYAVKQKMFNSFLLGGVLVIPADTTISVLLPQSAELQQPIEPSATVVGNRVQWNGYKYSNRITLNYTIFKQIASFDFNAAFTQILQSDLFWVVIAAIAIISFGLFLKRDKIAGKIEAYVVEHSNFQDEEE